MQIEYKAGKGDSPPTSAEIAFPSWIVVGDYPEIKQVAEVCNAVKYLKTEKKTPGQGGVRHLQDLRISGYPHGAVGSSGKHHVKWTRGLKDRKGRYVKGGKWCVVVQGAPQGLVGATKYFAKKFVEACDKGIDEQAKGSVKEASTKVSNQASIQQLPQPAFPTSVASSSTQKFDNSTHGSTQQRPQELSYWEKDEWEQDGLRQEEVHAATEAEVELTGAVVKKDCSAPDPLAQPVDLCTSSDTSDGEEPIQDQQDPTKSSSHKESPPSASEEADEEDDEAADGVLDRSPIAMSQMVELQNTNSDGPLATLGIAENSDVRTIKVAGKSLSFRTHPDKVPLVEADGRKRDEQDVEAEREIRHYLIQRILRAGKGMLKMRGEGPVEETPEEELSRTKRENIEKIQQAIKKKAEKYNNLEAKFKTRDHDEIKALEQEKRKECQDAIKRNL